MNQMGSRNGLIQEMGFPCGAVVKNLPANSGDAGLIPGSGRSPGAGTGNLLQYSCLENPRDGGAWWAAVYVVTQGQTRLSTQTSINGKTEAQRGLGFSKIT